MSGPHPFTAPAVQARAAVAFALLLFASFAATWQWRSREPDGEDSGPLALRHEAGRGEPLRPWPAATTGDINAAAQMRVARTPGARSPRDLAGAQAQAQLQATLSSTELQAVSTAALEAADAQERREALMRLDQAPPEVLLPVLQAVLRQDGDLRNRLRALQLLEPIRHIARWREPASRELRDHVADRDPQVAALARTLLEDGGD